MRGVARWAVRGFAGVGVVLTAILVTGLVLDVSNFDRMEATERRSLVRKLKTSLRESNAKMLAS